MQSTTPIENKFELTLVHEFNCVHYKFTWKNISIIEVADDV